MSYSGSTDLVTWSNDLAAITRPTILEVWAPTCVECKAMQSDLGEVAEVFSGRVDLKMINAVEESEAVRGLGVRATPTLIGVREGKEVFRIIGRRSRTDLCELFAAVAVGTAAPVVNRQDVVVRISAGSVLFVAGLTSGPVWPLVVLGAAVLVYGIAAPLWARRG